MRNFTENKLREIIYFRGGNAWWVTEDASVSREMHVCIMRRQTELPQWTQWRWRSTRPKCMLSEPAGEHKVLLLTTNTKYLVIVQHTNAIDAQE